MGGLCRPSLGIVRYWRQFWMHRRGGAGLVAVVAGGCGHWSVAYIINEITLQKINSDFLSDSLSEDEIIKTISDVYKKNKLILDPHTAIGFAAFDKASLEGNKIVLATALPERRPPLSRNICGRSARGCLLIATYRQMPRST